MCTLTHQHKTFTQTFIQFSFQYLSWETKPSLLNNRLKFDIIEHNRMMFWMCLIVMLCERYCLMCIKSKPKGEFSFSTANLQKNMESDIIWDAFCDYLEGFHFSLPCHTLVPRFREKPTYIHINTYIQTLIRQKTYILS